MDLRIREQRLPGIGRRYDVDLDRDRRLVIVVQHSGARQVSVVSGRGGDPESVVSLDHDQAVAVAALLMGVRFSFDTRDDDRVECDEVGVDTVILGPESPAVGALAREVELPPDSDAAILAVIRDDPADLVEDEPHEPFRAGDRVVVAARQDRLEAVRQLLNG
jgi:TrkA domain protein